MPYPPEHRQRIRRQIVHSARKLFNNRGFEAVSIDDIMVDAGLTRGGFYSYFKNKVELYVEAVSLILTEHPAETWEGVEIDFNAEDVAPQIVRAYLSRQHYEDINQSCPLVALPSDVTRSAHDNVKEAYQTVFLSLVGVIQQSLERRGQSNRDRALTIAAACVGGMVLARALADGELADELRDAALRIALDLGGWPPE